MKKKTKYVFPSDSSAIVLKYLCHPGYQRFDRCYYTPCNGEQ